MKKSGFNPKTTVIQELSVSEDVCCWLEGKIMDNVENEMAAPQNVKLSHHVIQQFHVSGKLSLE
jgi:hypothetical protein